MKTKKRIVPIMKNLIAISLFLFSMLNIASAQDIIILKTGEEIKAKVTEIGTTVVKYMKFDNQTGPVYAVDKTDVFMVKYENGTKDVFDYQPVTHEILPHQNESDTQGIDGGKLTAARGGTVMKDKQKLKPYEVKAIMSTNYAALKRYKGARAFNTLGIIFSVIGGIDIGLAVSYTMQGYDATGNFLIGGLELATGLAFSSISNNKVFSSILIYNSGLKKHQTSSLNLGLTPNGLGMCLKF